MDKNFKRNFLKGSLATSIGQIASISLQFVSMMVLARSVIKEEFGIFSLILAIGVFLQLISGLGLDTTLIKYLSSNKDELQSKKLQDLINLRIGSLLLIAFSFFISSKFFTLFDSRINHFTIQIIFIFFLNSLRDFYYAQLQGLRKFKEFAVIQFVSALTKFIAYLLGLILYSINLEFLVYVEIGALLFSFIFQQFLVPINIKINFRLKMKTVAEIMKFAYPLYFNNLLAVINNRTNAFIISGFQGPVSLAHYEIGGKIPDAINRLYNSFILVFFPNISLLVSEGRKKEAHNFINKAILNINLLILPVIIVIYFFQQEITITLFSKNYIESSFALFLFMLVFYFRSIGSIIGYSLVAYSKNLLSFNANFFGVITGVVISIILTPLLGFEGAIYGIIFSRVISSGLGIIYLNKQSVKVSYLNTIVPLLFCAPFIAFYEIVGFNEMIYKIILVIIFILIEIVLFKELRSTLLKIINSIKTSVFINIKGLNKRK